MDHRGLDYENVAIKKKSNFILESQSCKTGSKWILMFASQKPFLWYSQLHFVLMSSVFINGGYKKQSYDIHYAIYYGKTI